mmetsp:Transcript_41294/g.78944  ORF Transcript_41294/g.78944 Transcript_41294/m.78944 type:complete len:478 (+) Transcript_41294:159-1592(+)
MCSRPTSPTHVVLVKRLSGALSDEMVQVFFKRYGALEIRRTESSGRPRDTAFVTFADVKSAGCAIANLHGMHLLGKVLTVEYAHPKPSTTNILSGASAALTAQETPSHPSAKRQVAPASAPSSWPTPTDGTHPQSVPSLKYAYPPADAHVLHHICETLARVPRLYTQVLHLMNKMNLPAPFRRSPTPFLAAQTSSLPLPPQEDRIPCYEDDDGHRKGRSGLCSACSRRLDSHGKRKRREDELAAELETDEDTDESEGEKHGRSEGVHNASGAVRLACTTLTSATAAESTAASTRRSSRVYGIRRSRPVIQVNIRARKAKLPAPESPPPTEISIQAAADVVKTDALPADSELSSLCDVSWPPISKGDLEAKRMPLCDLAGDPKFQKYHPGEASCILYLKNLARGVTEEDLVWLFGNCFESKARCTDQMHLRLMQEGRMKGQAFATFPSVQLAQLGMETAHRVVLKGKPVIVQFGRAGK